MTNQAINDQEAHFFHNKIQFRYQPEKIYFYYVFPHHFIRFYYGTSQLATFFQRIAQLMFSFQHLNWVYMMFWLLALETTSKPALVIKRQLFTLFNVVAQLRSYLRAGHADKQVSQKGMGSNVTRLGPETDLRAPVTFEPVHFQL